MKMTTKQLAAEISSDLQLSNKAAEEQLKALFTCIGENIAAGHEITIPGFGKFKTNHRPARTGRNPRTGEALELPAKTSPKFLPAKQLKEACNE